MFLKYMLLLFMLFTALHNNMDVELVNLCFSSKILHECISAKRLTCMHTLHCRWLLDFAPPSFAYQSKKKTEYKVKKGDDSCSVMWNFVR